MNRFGKLIAVSTISAVLSAGAILAQDDHHDADHHDNHTYVEHKDWKKGYHMSHDDWARGEAVDYKTYHLKAPPKGYEWRLIDGNYVLGAVDTGVVSMTIVAGH